MASQHSDSELFERIVQEVIRRLVAGGVTVGATGNKQLALSERVTVSKPSRFRNVPW